MFKVEIGEYYIHKTTRIVAMVVTTNDESDYFYVVDEDGIGGLIAKENIYTKWRKVKYDSRLYNKKCFMSRLDKG